MLCLGQSAAVAGRADDERQARTHYTAGKTLYDLGNYSDALRELLLGYARLPRPQFLLNIGQCYRKLDEPAKAREMYQKYLRDTRPDDRERPQVEALIQELDKQIAAQTPPPPVETPPPVVETPAPPPVVETPPPVEPAPVVAASPAPAPVVVVATPGPPPKPKRRAWWAIPVAVVAAAGLSVGLYFALRPSCNASFGCLSAGGGN